MPTHTHKQAVHRSWYGSQQPSPSPPQPFIATTEPIDATSEERDQHIICQKTLMLASQLFPHIESSKDLQIEHVGTGSFHDVVIFTVPTLKLVAEVTHNNLDSGCFTVEEDKYVVRIPRSDITDGSVDMRRNIAILRGLEGKVGALIPRVVTFDTGKENALEAPYTLETRLRGRSLEDLVGSGCTNEAQNVSAFKQVVEVVETLAVVTSPYAGCIAETFGEGTDERLCVTRIPVRCSTFRLMRAL